MHKNTSSYLSLNIWRHCCSSCTFMVYLGNRSIFIIFWLQWRKNQIIMDCNANSFSRCYLDDYQMFSRNWMPLFFHLYSSRMSRIYSKGIKITMTTGTKQNKNSFECRKATCKFQDSVQRYLKRWYLCHLLECLWTWFWSLRSSLQ